MGHQDKLRWGGTPTPLSRAQVVRLVGDYLISHTALACGPKRMLSSFQKLSGPSVNAFILSPAWILPGCSHAQVPPPAGHLQQDASSNPRDLTHRPHPCPTCALAHEGSASLNCKASSPVGTPELLMTFPLCTSLKSVSPSALLTPSQTALFGTLVPWRTEPCPASILCQCHLLQLESLLLKTCVPIKMLFLETGAF